MCALSRFEPRRSPITAAAARFVSSRTSPSSNKPLVPCSLSPYATFWRPYSSTTLRIPHRFTNFLLLAGPKLSSVSASVYIDVNVRRLLWVHMPGRMLQLPAAITRALLLSRQFTSPLPGPVTTRIISGTFPCYFVAHLPGTVSHRSTFPPYPILFLAAPPVTCAFGKKH